MRVLILALLVALALGCAKSSITMIDDRGKPITFEQRIGGRGCIAATTNSAGGIDVVVQQDGSSDWAGIRVLPTLVRTAIVAMFGDRDLDSEPGMDGPSDIRGCGGLFEALEEG